MTKIFKIFIQICVVTIALSCGVTLQASANDVTVEQIVPSTYDDARDFSEGLAAVQKDGRWGYIDEKGNVVIDFKYLVAHSFSEDRAVVFSHVNGRNDDGEAVYYMTWGFIDKKGNFTPFVKSNGNYFGREVAVNDTEDYEFVGSYYAATGSDNLQLYNGYVYGKLEDNPVPYIIDKSGKEVLNDVGALHPPTEGFVATHFYDEPLYYDIKGNVAFEDKTFAQVRPFNKGLAPVTLKGKNYFTLMDTKGNILENVKFKNFYVYDYNKSYSLFNDYSLAGVQHTNGKWGAINTTGDVIIPYQYELLTVFVEGLAQFKQNGKYGFVDVQGHEIIPAQFDDTTLFTNGLALVKKGSSVYFIDKLGNKVNGLDDSHFKAYRDALLAGEGRSLPTNGIIQFESNEKFGFAKVNYTETVVPVTALAINQQVVEMETGDKIRLLLDVAPKTATNKVVKWTSTNSSVASIDANGNVTAKTVGITKIIVTSPDGNVTANATVVVNKPGQYAGYSIWSKPLTNASTEHSWKITLSDKINAKTVNSNSVLIVDANMQKVDFIQPKVDNTQANGVLTLENKGSFVKQDQYWIILTKDVTSTKGKSLGNVKIPFVIE